MDAPEGKPEGRRVYFQVWDWEDELTYAVHLFLVSEAGGGRWEARHHQTHYRAVAREELSGVLKEAGFEEITWLMPDESGYYQPIS